MITDKEYKLIFNKKKSLFLRLFSGSKILIFFSLLFVISYFLLNFPALIKKFNTKNISSDIQTKNNDPKVEVTKVPIKIESRVYIENMPNNSIAIPSLSISAPVIWNVTINDIYIQLQKGVVQLIGTSLPNRIGNVFISGHSSNYAWAPGDYNTIFAPLTKIKTDDQIIINYNNQQYLYKVNSIKTVSPSDVSVLEIGTTSKVTLMTCVPVGTALNRLIVSADLVEGIVYDSDNTNTPNLKFLPSIR